MYCYTSIDEVSRNDIQYVGVVQLQARGPHVVRNSVFNGPRKHSGKIFKYEIC